MSRIGRHPVAVPAGVTVTIEEGNKVTVKGPKGELVRVLPWTRIRTNNTIERLNREIKRRTKAIGAFPDGQSALMLVCARLRHVAGTQWGTRRYMNMEHLSKLEDDLLSDIIAG